MTAILLFVFVLCSGSVFGTTRYEKRFEELLPITAFSAVLILFLFGLCGLLEIGVYVVLLSAIVLWLFALSSAWKRRSFCHLLRSFKTPVPVLFLGTAVVYGILFRGKLVSSWDEYTHWVDVVKVMTIYNDFGTNVASGSYFASYPPAMSLFQYLLQSFHLLMNRGAAFREDLCNVAFHLLAFCTMAPLLKNCSWKKPFHLLAGCVVVYLSPLLFYSNYFFNNYIDPVQGIFPASGMAMIFLTDSMEKNGLYDAYILLLCAVLSLIKDAALTFAIFVAAAWVLDRGGLPSRMKEKSNWLRIGMALLAVMLPTFLWKLEIKISSTEVQFNAPVDLGNLVGEDGYRIQVAKNFIAALYEMTIPLGNTGFQITLITWLLLCIFMLCTVFMLYRKYTPENLTGKTAVLLLTAIQTIVYVAGMCIVYMFKFTRNEALNLAAMDRYICVAYLCCWMFALFALLNISDRYLQFGKMQMFSCVLAALIVIPTRPVIGFVLRNGIRSAADNRAAYATLHDEIMKYCQPGDRVYLVSQGDDGEDLNAMHFIARPVEIGNQICSFGQPRYEDDPYVADFPATEWQRDLAANYDYVAILGLEDHFLETYSSLFVSPECITENAVYQVNPQTGMLSKCEGW